MTRLQTFIYVLATMLMGTGFYPFSASATVITVDVSGQYQTDEAKDFRQRGINDDQQTTAEPVADISRVSLDMNVSAEPFMARIIPSPSEAQKLAPTTELAVLPKTNIPTDSSTSRYETIIREAALKNTQLDVALIKAVIAVESNYNTTAISQKGAMGLMQLMPETAERHGVTNPFDPKQNIEAGAKELNTLMEANANISLALAAYNAGQAAVIKHKGIPPYKETQNYVVKVLTKTFHDRRASLAEEKPATETKTQTEDDQKLRPMKVYSYDW